VGGGGGLEGGEFVGGVGSESCQLGMEAEGGRGAHAWNKERRPKVTRRLERRDMVVRESVNMMRGNVLLRTILVRSCAEFWHAPELWAAAVLCFQFIFLYSTRSHTLSGMGRTTKIF
jgi:hypothetical protein